MADLTFDAVICGGGNKALMLAMYLSRYAGMSVGVFERRHEIGGGLATEESAAPGFRGNPHANLLLPWYYAPLYRDFPEFWEYGGQVDQYPVGMGSVFLNSNNCLCIYSEKEDPTQERTAKEIARFSQKDAETWLRFWKLWNTDEFQSITLDTLLNPHDWQTQPEFLNRQIAVYPKLLEAGIDPDSMILAASPKRAGQEWFDSQELLYTMMRATVSYVTNPDDPQLGATALGMAMTMATHGYARGGTHQIAHACHQILVQSGVKFFTHAEVAKAIIENGQCTGIRLVDGSQIKARKIVVSAGLSAWQLVELMGRDVIGEKIARRIDNLSTRNIGNLMWYTFALHEAPKYKSASFNPDINRCEWLGLTNEANIEHISIECNYARMGKFPPMEHYNPVVWCHSLADASYAPEGKHTAQCEMQGPRATDLTEAEWLKVKNDYADDLLKIWQKHAPNMTWDNVIGVDSNSPYDNLRLKNLAPHGNFAGIDKTHWQNGPNRPTPELANHRTPVKNLYATGGFWWIGGNASCEAGYNCYKTIAKDLNLPKPWEEKGKEEPMSLVQSTRWCTNKMRESFKPRVL
jgi:beta-carotene ketolase (CrtO type)